MEFDCFVYPGWEPRIRPATRRRAWMDASPEAFAYRCLPLAMANSHGWEITNACGFEARWAGGDDASQVEIRLDHPNATSAPVSLFGQGTITFHVEGLFRTPPGWNLWVGGPPNDAKDGIAPLGGLIETDWSPYSFTMNWRFTRSDHWVRFEADETICFLFPVQRGAIDAAVPRLRPIDEAPELKRQFETWSASRDTFQERMRETPPLKPGDKWQKFYYRGVDALGVPTAAEHQSKLRAPTFVDVSSSLTCPARHVSSSSAPDALRLARRDWMMMVQEGLRALSPHATRLHSYVEMDADFFLQQHYAANVPVILAGEMLEWPALHRWTPDYLAALLGDRQIEYQGGRGADPRFESDKDQHRRALPFDRYIDLICRPGADNEAYLTANSANNLAALAPMYAELGQIDKLLEPTPDGPDGMLWIGPAGIYIPLHHNLTNNLVAQVVGRKRVVLVPPCETSKLDTSRDVVSSVGDLLDPEVVHRLPHLRDLKKFDLVLEPGQMLFVPIGWWHQVTTLDFSISVTYTNFRWPNAWHVTFPFEPVRASDELRP